MEFVDGPSLSKVMKQGGLRPPQVRELRDRLADGLAAAHDKGVIHRDLSPDNVILPGGELTKAKIIDFGISKMADPEVKTIVGDDFAGKYSYVSPEQVGLYGGKVDPRSDIYSLGLVLAAAAGGAPLDMGSSPISVVEARRARPKLDRVPADLRTELTAMLQPDPADRPQSMRDLMPEKSPPRRPADTGRDRRPAVTSARKAEPSGPRNRVALLAGALVLVLAIAGGLAYWLLMPPEPKPIPQPPVDKIALLRQAAEAALQGFQCAELSARVSQLGDVDVIGYVASDADSQQVIGRLQALPDVGHINNQVAVMQPPLCTALGALDQAIAARLNDPQGPQIDPGGAVGTYFAGQSLRIGVTASSLFKGYLYIDYVDGTEGYVVHLFPNQFRRDNAVEPGARVDIGTLPEEIQGYRVKAPFGRSLIIAVSTPEPLFDGLRPTFEEKDAARQ